VVGDGMIVIGMTDPPALAGVTHRYVVARGRMLAFLEPPPC
jgi:hypothetical protein